jgi:glutathione S-transferase
MKLFYSPGACSLSPHIVLRETGLPHELVRVDLRAKKTADGGDYWAINPAGSVPTLQLDSGETLTEGPAIVQYLGDLAPQSGIVPAAGTMARYRLIEALNFISTELHKSYSPLVSPQHAGRLQAGGARDSRGALRRGREDAGGQELSSG